MKIKFFIICLIFVFISSCADSNTDKSESSEEVEAITSKKNGLKGAWELKGFYNYQDNKVVDSFENNTLSRQIKMYTDTKVMWCKLLKTDSIEFFGYGSYTYDDGLLTEVLEFGSAFMNDVIEEQQEFVFQFELGPDRFEQIEIDEDGNRIYSENYVRIE
ncbi:hypothetical protein [Winogradskyella alexanderae]|uniref:Lipocalin-like domain-containing protein n=1 Tax=Winogradskyella alexanderae TaxID=2877123 RepID=A0ABS7XQK7_9FLAO|nr:hypothetical protein [Winogradskyella alexanderae]MCA0132287.1 hypothetical protein [Winogradskyella alexanderae]